MGLLSIMLIILATIFTSAADVQQQTKSYSATTINGRFIMTRLNFDIAQARLVSAPSSLGSTSATLLINVNGLLNTYTLSGNDLQLTENSNTDNLNSNDVSISNLSFQKLGNIGGKPTINYSFTVSSNAKSHGSADIQTFTGTAGLKWENSMSQVKLL